MRLAKLLHNIDKDSTKTPRVGEQQK